MEIAQGSVAAPPAPASRAQAARRKSSKFALLGASLSMALVAAVHGAGYVTASIAVRNSGLAPYFQKAFRALWLGYALQALVVAGLLALAALWPTSVSRAVLLLASLLPLVTGALLAYHLDSVLGSLLLLLAVLLLGVGVALRGGPALSPKSRAA